MNYIDNENKDENISKEIENIESVEDENSIIGNIVKTGNIELYDSLSIEEKTDYKIVRRLIIKYYFNRDFTLKVAKNYIDHKRFDVDDKEYIEILVLINKFKTYLNENRPEEEELRFKLEMFYNTIWKYAENRVEEEIDDKKLPKRFFGLGYKYIAEKYMGNGLIKDYIATRKLNEIFEDRDIIEKYIHNMYETKEEFSMISLPRFVTNYVYDIDAALSSYFTSNTDLFNSIVKRYSTIIYNWDAYEVENDNSETVESKDICEFINMYCDGSIPKEITKRQVFKYLGKKINKKELYDYAKVLEKEEDDEIACYIYVTKIEDAEEEIKKRGLPELAFPIITIEEDITTIYNTLSSSTINWLNKLESVVVDIYKKGIESLKKAKLDYKEENVAKVIKFDPNKKS